jgi:hypothetical protein
MHELQQIGKVGAGIKGALQKADVTVLLQTKKKKKKRTAPLAAYCQAFSRI